MKMRNFLLISNTVDTSKPLSLNSLTGYGRLDVICRCISAAFFLSNNFRKNVCMEIFFRMNEQILEIQGEQVRGINPDERAVAGVLKRVFSGKSFPGIRLYSGSLQQFLNKNQPLLIDANGTNSLELIKDHPFFLIGDQLGFLNEDEHLLNGFKKISLGSNVYLSSQVITILNYHLDTMKYDFK